MAITNKFGQYFTARNVALAALMFVSIGACIWAWQAADQSFANLWLTPDQQADRMMKRRDYKRAAELYHDPLRKGGALYRDGQFKEAAGFFGRDSSPEAAFDRGNALVMLGKYADAITSYDAALKQRPDWQEAKSNRELAEARLRTLAPPKDDEGTGGQEKADEIVFDDRPKQSGGEHDEQIVAGGEMSDEEIQSLWLRRVQTKPADFLRAKFAYQLSRRDQKANAP